MRGSFGSKKAKRSKKVPHERFMRK